MCDRVGQPVHAAAVVFPNLTSKRLVTSFPTSLRPQDPSLAEQAYARLRDEIVRLEYSPGDVLREDELREKLGIGRTPIREAIQRLAREHFVVVVPRQGMFVAGLDVSELSMLFETRSVLEPYAARLAAARGSIAHWDAMAEALDSTTSMLDGDVEQLMTIDRLCHELTWDAAGNRFLVDSLDSLYAQSDRLWHLYLADVADMSHAVGDHEQILERLRTGDGEGVAELMETHVHAFDEQIREAVTASLGAPLGP